MLPPYCIDLINGAHYKGSRKFPRQVDHNQWKPSRYECDGMVQGHRGMSDGQSVLNDHVANHGVNVAESEVIYVTYD